MRRAVTLVAVVLLVLGGCLLVVDAVRTTRRADDVEQRTAAVEAQREALAAELEGTAQALELLALGEQRLLDREAEFGGPRRRLSLDDQRAFDLAKRDFVEEITAIIETREVPLTAVPRAVLREAITAMEDAAAVTREDAAALRRALAELQEST